MSLHSPSLCCYYCGRLVPSFPRKAPLLLYLPSHLPAVPSSRIFQLFFCRDTVLLQRATLTVWIIACTWDLRRHLPTPPLPSLPNTVCLWLGGWVCWLINCCKSCPHLPAPAALPVPLGPSTKHSLTLSPGCWPALESPLQPTDRSPAFSPRLPCLTWPQASRCSLNSEQDSPQNGQLHTKGPQLVPKPLLPESSRNNTWLTLLL